MPNINFQNNFGTNLTSGTTAGDTTSPLNSIPTVDAPYYLAFDATNLNSHYEVVLVTSDTATNVNHAATAYSHTTDEEVRMIVPAVHLNTWQNLAEGQMINGRILPSVASDNLTVALKTLAGTDPSATDPVYVMIGGVLRSITSALTWTNNAGSNFLAMGSAELATKEVDIFYYLGWSVANASVFACASRIPYATVWGDFSATSVVEKGKINSANADDVATNVVVNVGRFAATLSAGAGYTWSVPTFTAKNLIQRPIYETRWLDYVPTLVGWSGTPTRNFQIYKIINDICYICLYIQGTSNATTITFTSPLSKGGSGTENAYFASGYAKDNGTGLTAPAIAGVAVGSSTWDAYKTAGLGVWTNTNQKDITFNLYYEI